MTTAQPTLVRGISVALALASAASMFAQAASPNDAATLAKYDKNKNGVLDPSELAQKASDDAKAAGAILLTPFEVSTDKDVGYAAGNTLSGGRVDTPLAITPGSISVMTKEFMDDFNITNMNEAGSWTMGFDLGTSVPNSDPSSISVYQNIVRGAPSTDNFPTRNGSINFGAADSYNTERYEFQRGPDTSMFGDGGPGGRQGSTSKRARFNSATAGFSLQGDTFGGHRATLDYSKGWDRFGLRFNALNQNAPGFQDGTPKIKNAWTLNAVTKLGRNTHVIAEFERVSEWNNLWSITNGDAQSQWDSVTVNNDNSALLANNNTNLNNAGLERMTVGANGSAPTMFVWNFATGDMQDYGGNQYRTRGINGAAIRIPYVGNRYLLAVPARRAAIPGIDKHFSAAPKDNVADRDASTTSLNVEHRVGNLFVRVGYVKNDFDNNTIWSNPSPNASIIDVNRLLPNGAPNPRFLRTFSDVEQNNIYSQDAIREFYGLATYRFFVPKWWDYKQQMSLNLSDRETQSENRTSAWRRTDNPAMSDPFNNANRFFYRVYWGDPRPDLGPVLSNPNGKVPGRWAYTDTVGNITDRAVQRAALTSQSAFFNEKLALTVSYSRDKVEVKNLPRLAAGLPGSTGAPDFKNLLGFTTAGNPFQRKETASSIAYGIVAYPFQTERLGFAKKFLSPLGFVFNYAENNQPPSSGVQNPLLDGTLPPLTHSETRDLGLRYSIPGGKAYLTVSRYQTTQRDNPAAFGSAGDIANIWTNLGYTDPALTTTTAGVGFAYSDPNSRRLEGWEVELTANPTRNITLNLNYSHPVSYIITESEDRKAYVAAHRAEWEAGAKAAQGAVINGKTILDPTLIQTALNNIDNSLNGLTTGTLENNQVRHRVNLAGAYSFREGMLKGLRLNTGVQYRGHGKNGSRDARLKFGIPDSAPNPTVLQNTQAAFDYLWTPPAWRNSLVAGANYTTRIGKHQTRFQLNVTNVLNHLEPIWGRSGPVGNFASAYTTLTTNQLFAGNSRQQILTSFVNPDPRKFVLSTTVSF